MGWRAWAERYCGKQAVMALFVICALPVTMLTALLTPPNQSPDELMHYCRALGLLHGAVLPVRKTAPDVLFQPQLQTGVKVDYELLAIMLDPQQVALKDAIKAATMRHRHGLLFVDMPNTAVYFPTAYLPAALGTALALAFDASPLHCLLTARLVSAGAFLLVGLAALAIAAYGEAVLVTVLLLPMTLFLAGTLNQDGLLIAMTCLAAACLTRATRGWRIAGLVAFALVLGAKPPYILLMGVFTLPLFAPGFWRRFSDMAVAMLPVLCWAAAVALFFEAPFIREPYFPGSLFTGDHQIALDTTNAGAQLHILLSRPQRFLALPYYSTINDAYTDYIGLIGVFGRLTIILDPGFYGAWAFSLVFAALGLLLTRRGETVPPRTALINFLAVMGAIAVTYWLIEITLYLTWTNVGWPNVMGSMGRYFIIFLPFLPFGIPHLQSLPRLRSVRFSLPPLLLALPSLGMGVFDIGYIPQKLVLNYYLH